MSDWISVKDRVPEEGEYVLILEPIDKEILEYQERFNVAHWLDGMGWIDWCADDVSPTHWMPLPEPPKPED